MATNSKQTSLVISLLVISLIVTSVLAISCNNKQEDGVWIPVPPDTSALGRKKHFIPMADMTKFMEMYKPMRDSMGKCIPGLYIPISEAFNKQALIDILKNPKSVGIRIYYGLKPGPKNNEMRLILVGVDEQGRDLYVQGGTGGAAAQADSHDDGGEEYGQCNPPCNVDSIH